MCSQIYSVLPRYLSFPFASILPWRSANYSPRPRPINQVWLNLHPFSCKFRVILVRFLCPPPPPPPPPPNPQRSWGWVGGGGVGGWGVGGGGGVYWIHPVCLSVRLSVCLSVCPSVCLSVCLSTFRVRPVAFTVQDGFFPYLVQMINSMRGCVACDDPWSWPISSRSFGLYLENRVRSLASTWTDSFYIWHKWSLSLEAVSRVPFSEFGNLNW